MARTARKHPATAHEPAKPDWELIGEFIRRSAESGGGSGSSAYPAWTEFRDVDEQIALWQSTKRFVVVPAGRRSGKTEIALRRLALSACLKTKPGEARYLFGAPTWTQAKDIGWVKLLELIPRMFWAGEPDRSNLRLRLKNQALVGVFGFDKPARVEGTPLAAMVLDEYGNMKPEVWPHHVRPALSTEGWLGWSWFIGVPEGRNHYWDLWCYAISGQDPEWEGFTWHSSKILPASEIESARRSMDLETFLQEYQGEFRSFAGRVYYAFDRDIHAARPRPYDPKLPLEFCFDFNIMPGTAAVVQTHRRPLDDGGGTEDWCIDEVFREKNSTTRRVCQELCQRWGELHEGEVVVFGDPAGGGRNPESGKSNWDAVREELAKSFEGRIRYNVALADPGQIARVNAMNSRLMSAAGEARFFVDPKCMRVIKDFEGVSLHKDGSGKIDKPMGTLLGHLSDAICYRQHRLHPLRRGVVTTEYL